MGSFGSNSGQMDTLVLGCTHYPFAAEQLRDLLGPQVQLISNGPAVARQTRIKLLGLASPATVRALSPLTLLSTGEPRVLQAAAQRWLTPTPAEPAYFASKLNL
jgi:glutamate racemase